MKTFCYSALLALLVAAAPAYGGTMHARSSINLGSFTVCAPEGGTAHAAISRKSLFKGTRYRVSHESPFENYTYGNEGSGHAHHHTGGCPNGFAPGPLPGLDPVDAPPPVMGEPGSTQLLLQTWVPDPSGTMMTVSFDAGNFLQLDLADLSDLEPLVVEVEIAADGGIAGVMRLEASVNAAGLPSVQVLRSGVFDGLAYRLTAGAPGTVALQLLSAASWTVPGSAGTFNVTIEGRISGVLDADLTAVSAPMSLLLLLTGLLGLLASQPCRLGIT